MMADRKEKNSVDDVIEFALELSLCAIVDVRDGAPPDLIQAILRDSNLTSDLQLTQGVFDSVPAHSIKLLDAARRGKTRARACSLGVSLCYLLRTDEQK